jgi:hypothetical protein
MFDRDKAVNALISDDINDIIVSKEYYNDESYIDNILRVGFKGYEHMTDDELMQELQERDISTVFGEYDD